MQWESFSIYWFTLCLPQPWFRQYNTSCQKSNPGFPTMSARYGCFLRSMLAELELVSEKKKRKKNCYQKSTQAPGWGLWVYQVGSYAVHQTPALWLPSRMQIIHIVLKALFAQYSFCITGNILVVFPLSLVPYYL